MFTFMRKQKELRNKIKNLIDKAETLETEKEDIEFARELFEHNEHGVSFETLITQMYERNVKISSDFYTLVCDIAAKMNLPEKDYIFMQDLIEKCFDKET